MTSRKPSTILLVDDEQAYREAVADVLGEQGHTVVQAASAADAMRLLETVTPELMMLDIMMPGEDGMTLLRRLASDPRFLPVPIVMASAKLDPTCRWSAWESGASAYLVKPYTVDEVTSLVEHLVAPLDPADVEIGASELAAAG